jgi:hypothetical protein
LKLPGFIRLKILSSVTSELAAGQAESGRR